MQQIKSFAGEFAGKKGYSRHIAARPVQARDQAELDWIGAERENNWNRGGGSLRRKGGWTRIERHDHGHPALNEFCRKWGQSKHTVIRPAIFYLHRPTLDEAGRSEALTECGHIAFFLSTGTR